jgi:hypothetical protein
MEEVRLRRDNGRFHALLNQLLTEVRLIFFWKGW